MTISLPLVEGVLTLVAALSPLLTFAHLWQVKEWRTDRLREHIREEGCFRQVFGIVRPAIIALAVALVLLPDTVLQAITLWPSKAAIPFSALILLCALSLIQLLLQRQPFPVWTKKAITLVGSSLLLTTFISAIIFNFQFSIFNFAIVLLQPFILAIAWTLWKPVDAILKRRILGRAKDLRARHPDLLVIGISGSVGKTTTKELLAHILAEGNPLVTPAHVNSEIGVARWLLQSLPKLAKDRRQGTADRGSPVPNPQSSVPRPLSPVLIAEMGAYRRGEIAVLCDVLNPRIGIITFIGTQHVALFGSQDAIREAKGELFAALPRSGKAFLNADSALCRSMAEYSAAPVTLVGTSARADIEARDIEETGSGIRFSALGTIFDVPLHGTHNVTNALLAIAVASRLEMPLRDIAQRLRSFQPLQRTFELRRERGVTILDDTHNASAPSFKAAIGWARAQPFERKVLLTPGLIEMGEERARAHAELGVAAANVFTEAYVLNARAAHEFAKGFGRSIPVLPKVPEPLPAGTLLVCVGRMTEGTIKKLLPRSSTIPHS